MTQYHVSHRLVKLFVSVVFLLISSQLMAWSSLGHQAVCDIAWRDSSPAIKKILSASAKRMGYHTFAESCVWADHIKSNERYDKLKPLHYVNVPRAATSVASSSCLSSSYSSKQPQCILSGITYYFEQLTNTSNRQDDRDKDLLLLGHFVGDVHQPLHVSYQDDRGGTRKYVVFEGKPLSLHRLWDSEIVTCSLSSRKERSWRHLGRTLYAKRSAVEENTELLVESASSPSIASTVQLWADESLDLTRNIYSRNLSKRLSPNYCKQYSTVAQQRLLLAGLRLSTLLRVALKQYK